MIRRIQTATDPTTLAIVLAGGNGSRLGNLTADECKPALSFGGHYRNIDFALSNCVNSGVRRIAVLTQYKAHSLIEHIATGWNWLPRALGEFVEIWPAQQRSRSGHYRGTAHAVVENVESISDDPAEQLLVLAGDHIYKMDYRPMLAQHRHSGADITVACVPVPLTEASQLGVVVTDGQQKATEFIEKPQVVPAAAIQAGQVLASMGIYVISRQYLLNQLSREAQLPDSEFDFGRHVLPSAVKDGRVSVYTFKDVHGQMQYWRDIGTLDAYWAAHMDLLQTAPPINLNDPDWPVMTANMALSPSRVLAESLQDGSVTNSLLGAGTVVDNARLDRTVLANSSSVGKGSSLDECVILPGARIGERCKLRRVIVGAGTVVDDGTRLASMEDAALRGLKISANGITLLTRHCPIITARAVA